MADGFSPRKNSDTSPDWSHTDPEISIHLEALPPTLQAIPPKFLEKRKTPRFRANFDTAVFCSGASFRSKSINISANGLLLADSIPSEFVNQPLEIVIVRRVGNSRDFLLVKGKALEAPMRSPRIQFTEVLPPQRSKLESFLFGLEPLA